jgi:hypothetical protein
MSDGPDDPEEASTEDTSPYEWAPAEWLPDTWESAPIKPSRPVDKWRRGSVAGAILTGVAMGLAEVFEPDLKDRAPIVIEARDPSEPRAVELDLDFDDPAASVVTYHPPTA